MSVEYREITNHKGRRVGNDGSVWSCWVRGHTVVSDKWIRLRPSIGSGGYLTFSLKLDGKTRTYRVHEVVAEAFHGKRPDGMQCCHIDGNPASNRADNLRWGTPSSNQQDRIRHGTHEFGDQNPNAKLDSKKVAEIRSRLANGETHRVISKDYGVTPGTIRHIAAGRTWNKPRA